MSWLIIYAVVITFYAINQKLNNSHYIDSVDRHMDFLSMTSTIREDRLDLAKSRLKKGFWSDFGL
jgi:hypothetical protein